MADYPISVAKRDFSKLMRRAEAGEIVRITRRGKCLVRIEIIPDIEAQKQPPEAN
ncbi:MAG TPA: type II toxin-antitoxin system prevent-host-death family antitoxin [Caulobacteraceae bacterium]